MDEMSLVTTKEQETWAEVIDAIVESLDESDAPDDVIKVAELLLAGYSTTEVAKKLNLTKATVRAWITKYPIIAKTIADNKKFLTKWRLAQLEKLFLSAIERSREILDVGLDGFTPDGRRVDPKVLTVVAAQARYFIGIFAAQQQNLTVTHELGETVMKAQENALDYLAQKLNAQAKNADQEPIEAVYRIIDPKMDATGPVLDENGEPFFGEFGKVDTNEEGTLCSICGKRVINMHTHLSSVHNITPATYEAIFMLEHGVISSKNEFVKRESEE